MQRWENGSSPRVRGKRIDHGRRQESSRIIPASAGQTVSRHPSYPPTSDHPRECGANPFTGLETWPADGSSPRVRGKRDAPQAMRGPTRIIPASAGQTPLRLEPLKQHADHPRECGANSCVYPFTVSHTGSSPRVRGKQCAGFPDLASGRIIPASAGQTVRRGRCGQKLTDHPRECGANVGVSTCGAPAAGSSPRVRGKLPQPSPVDREHRIIPASAGQTPARRPCSCVCTDHPRECGANLTTASDSSRRSGSSPRVRGKRHEFAYNAPRARIIPASAGQTRSPMVRAPR